MINIVVTTFQADKLTDEEQKSQLTQLQKTLSLCGAIVKQVDTEATAFVCDPLFLVEYVESDGYTRRNIALMANFQDNIYRATEVFKMLTNYPSSTLVYSSKHRFEGGNIIVDRVRNMALVGSEACSGDAALEISNRIRMPIYLLNTNKYFFHIDLLISTLPNGVVISCQEVLEELGNWDNFKKIMFKGCSIDKNFINISRDLLNHFFCNLRVINNHIIVQIPVSDVTPIEQERKFVHNITNIIEEFNKVINLLEELGYIVHTIDVSSFQKDRGGIHCLTSVPYVSSRADFTVNDEQQKNIQTTMRLYEAVLSDNSTELQNLLATNPEYLNAVFEGNGNSLLHIAIYNNKMNVFETLLIQGADINASNLAGDTIYDLVEEDLQTQLHNLLDKHMPERSPSLKLLVKQVGYLLPLW